MYTSKTGAGCSGGDGALAKNGATLQPQQDCRPEERERAHTQMQMRVRLEAFAVHNGGASLVVLLLGDPHLLEGGQRGQDGATDPH